MPLIVRPERTFTKETVVSPAAATIAPSGETDAIPSVELNGRWTVFESRRRSVFPSSVITSVSVSRTSLPSTVMRASKMPLDPTGEVPSSSPVRMSQRSTYTGPSLWSFGLTSEYTRYAVRSSGETSIGSNPLVGVVAAHRHVKDFFHLRQIAIDHFAFLGRATPWQMPNPA